MFELHAQLAQDCLPVGRFALCRLFAMNDANYPWFVLVPERAGVTEIYQMAEADQIQLMRESSALAAALAQGFHAHKINIAALGNMVPQLHLHHIVRYRDDPAWPAPVWGRIAARPYSAAARADLFAILRAYRPAGCDLHI